MNILKVLTAEGLQHLWKQISLEDYPNNETLVAVLNAIDETKADQSDVTALQDLVGNTAVSTQIANAVDAIPQPDWHQNDPTATDYIQNRPFYEEVGYGVVLEETEVQLSAMAGDLPPFELREGNNYTVTINNIDYEVICKIMETEGVSATILGNSYPLTENEDDNTDEPFLIISIPTYGLYGVYYFEESENITVKIIGDMSTIVQIPYKFVPNVDFDIPEGGDGYIKNKPNIKKGEGLFSVILNYPDNIASGDFSHVEGTETTASGLASHAEGSSATASGDYSHAEGSYTEASGNCSHAEGDDTTASGNCSHAEGNSTTASGYKSHAEGSRTTASGLASHAEGNNTAASGDYSHAEGDNTTAFGYGSHAEGRSSNRPLSNISINSNNIEIINEWQSAQFMMAKGSGAHTEGLDTLALGDCSHAEGAKTIASGDYSHAEGSYTEASGYNTHAEGSLTTASNHCSHAEGNETTASGKYSHAEGNETTASETYSHAEGNNTTASNQCAHAEGNITEASGHASHAEGNYTTASGSNAHAEGSHTTASGGDSHAEGLSTTALSRASHAEGSGTIASGDDSHAEGSNATASGIASHAEGYTTTASGEYSHAEGGYTTASEYASHAEGNYTTASGKYSHAEGSHTIASGDYQHVQGKYNIENTENNYAHIVGNGNFNIRSNAHTLDWDGNAWFQGEVKIGGTGQNDTTAKTLATTEYVDTVKNDLLNGASSAYDTLKELGDLIDDNQDAIEALKTVAANKAPKSHAADSVMYGAGTANKYGHVKLSDSIDMPYDTDDGIAATPASVKSVYNLASNIHSYSTFGFTNASSTFAAAPETGDGIKYLSAGSKNRSVNFIAGNELINFDVVDDGGNNPDTVTITINADYMGAADDALEEAKDYTDTQITNHSHAYGLPYGVCETAGDVLAKTVTVNDPNFKLKKGAVVIIKFTAANSVASPTLNVNGTGDKPIYRYGTTAASTATTTSGWTSGAVQMFTYDGNGWIRDYWANTTYSNAALGQGYTTCSTAASTTAKTASLSSYSLTTGGIVVVKFTNDVPANTTLNINKKGAKNIYYRGAKITANIIKAGDLATFICNGSQYHLLSIDRWQGDIADALNEAKEYVETYVNDAILGGAW